MHIAHICKINTHTHTQPHDKHKMVFVQNRSETYVDTENKAVMTEQIGMANNSIIFHCSITFLVYTIPTNKNKKCHSNFVGHQCNYQKKNSIRISEMRAFILTL